MKTTNNFNFKQFRIENTSDSIKIAATIQKIREYLVEKPISYWNDYTLFDLPLSRKYKSEEIEKALNGFTSNPIRGKINSVKIVYSAYEGILSIIPGDFDEYESYIEPNEMNFEEAKPEIYFARIYSMIEKLRTM